MFRAVGIPNGVLVLVFTCVVIHSVVRGRRGGEDVRGEEHPGARPRDDQTHATQTARNEQLQLAS